MTDKKIVGSVTYQNAGKDYFEKRGLRRHARVWSLWALGVGAVISGHFSGWNFGIGVGGWGGLFIAAHHHRDHVSRPDLLPRRDVARPAAHRRRLLVRAQRAWDRGAASSPASPRTSSTS